MFLDFFKHLFSPKTHKLGRWAEAKAADFLKNKGLKILHRNWRAGQDELDIIALERRQIVFVEVRARQAKALVRGVLTLTPAKHAALRRGVEAYLHLWKLKNPKAPFPSWRFDVVELCVEENGKYTISHFPCTRL